MIRALIVDDEPLPRERIRTLLAEHGGVEVVGECADGMEALHAIREQTPELVFLDVQMPGLDGFGVLDALPPEALPAIIFVTAYDAYALDAFEVNALDYLLKPIHPARFAKALARAVDRLGQTRPHAADEALQALVDQLRAERGYARRFAVRTGSRVTFVRTDEIEWVEAAANYAELHVGGRVHLIRETMKALEARLHPDVFVRIHHSYIINIDRVAAIEPCGHGEYTVTMKEGTCLNASRTYSGRLRALLGS